MVRFFHKAFTEVGRTVALPTDVVETYYWRHLEAINKGEMGIEEFNHILGKELGADNFDWTPYYLENVEQVPGINELVDWIADNYQIGIISNSMPGFIDELRKKGLIPETNYAAVVDSSKVGSTKPESKIYEVAQELASVEPGELLLIDDTRANLVAADRAGWHITWFDELQPEDSIARIKKALEF